MFQISKQTKKDLLFIVKDFCKKEHVPKIEADPKACVEAAIKGEYSFVVYDALGCDDHNLRLKDGKVVNEELETMYQNFAQRFGEGTYSYTCTPV